MIISIKDALYLVKERQTSLSEFIVAGSVFFSLD